MKKVVVICGPTASGKTKISIELAKYFNAEIISGDSVSVYKRLDIGSAKIKEEEKEGVIHHLIDLLDPTEEYSTACFQRHCRAIIDEVALPFIVGGTGLYIKSALYDYEFSDSKRDAEFASKFTFCSNQELFEMLEKYDSKACEKLHPNNRKRVLRALEMALNNDHISNKNKKDILLYDTYIIYLDLDRDVLYNRINKRVDLMLKEGLLEEVKGLYDDGIIINAIGYKEFIPYFKDEISLETAIEEIKKNTRHLAKRQITWFKNQMDTHFYQVDLANIEKTIENIKRDLEEFYAK